MNPPDIASLSASALARAIRDRRLRCTTVMETILERAHAVQGTLNAFLRTDDDAALDAARLADRELAAGQVRGPLHGVPMAHKDMFYRAGRASSCGSRITPERAAPSTATALERLDTAGAIQFGVLNMAEFAFGPTGHNWHYGHCRNAWDPARITGGSSSGSGTTVAARANYAALGSDTGGSIRLPATFCGVVGIKPTYGRVSRAGAMPLSYSTDTVGPLTRTVEDCATILGVIAGADPRDASCASRAVPDYLAALGQSVAGLRIGRARNPGGDTPDAEVAACLDASLEVFARLGARIVDVDLPDLDSYDAAWSMIVGAEAAAIHGNWLRTRPADYSDQVRTRLKQGFAVPATAYVDALRLRGDALQDFCTRVYAQCDVLHLPIVSFATPTIAETDVGGGPRMAELLAKVTRLTRPINYLGLPALAVPTGFPGGLPVAMQLIGRPYDEATLFRCGHAYQQATEWHLRSPG